jgi:hypothetical protein
MKIICFGLLAGLLLPLASVSTAAPHIAMRGIVNVPGLQLAVVGIDQNLRVVHQGDHFEDRSKSGEQLAVTVTEIDFASETVRLRINDEDYIKHLPTPDRPATAPSWIHLYQIPFDHVLELYEHISSRTILLHPNVSQASFTCAQVWSNQPPTSSEITDCLAKWCNEQGISVLEDGDVFVQILPTDIKDTAILSAAKLPAGPKPAAPGMIDFEGLRCSDVLGIYGQLLDRQRKGNSPVSGRISRFCTPHPLAKAQTIYAIETLLRWGGNKITLNDDHTFSVNDP